MLKRVTNTLYWVGDLDKSVQFYERVGFEPDEQDDLHASFKLGDFKILLVPPRDEEQFTRDAMSQAKGEGMYLYVEVDDVDATYQELTAKGLMPSSEPKDWPWGNREFVIKDPNGYKLCFWQTSQ